MSIKLTRKEKNDAINEQLKKLKKIGIFKNIAAAKKDKVLKYNDKIKIVKAWKKYHDIGNAPKDYKKINVKSLADWQIKKLEDTGYRLSDKKSIFIPLQGASSVKITRVKEKNASGFYESRIKINRTFHDKIGGVEREKIETEHINSAVEFLDWQQRLIREYDKIGKTEKDFIGIKVYDQGAWTAIRTDSIENMLRYINDMSWHANRSEIPELQNNVHLISIKVKTNYRDIDAGEKTQREINSSKYQKKKSEIKTKTRALIGEVKK